MINVPRNLDIGKVLIAPKYKKVTKNFYFIGGGLTSRTFYEDSCEWIAIYPSDKCNEYYNLSDNFEEIIMAADQVPAPDYSVNLNLSKKLTEFLQSSNLKYDIKNEYNDLLYLIEPINRMQEYLYRESKKGNEKISYDASKLITTSVYFNGGKLENQILEEHEYFLIDTNMHIPVSYGFINNEIPYILKSDLIKRGNNKCLIKSLFRK